MDSSAVEWPIELIGVRLVVINKNKFCKAVCLYICKFLWKKGERSENWHAGVFDDANQDSGSGFAKCSIN